MRSRRTPRGKRRPCAIADQHVLRGKHVRVVKEVTAVEDGLGRHQPLISAHVVDQNVDCLGKADLAPGSAVASLPIPEGVEQILRSGKAQRLSLISDRTEQNQMQRRTQELALP